MKVQQVHIKREISADVLAPLQAIHPNLVVVFGDGRFFSDGSLGQKLKTAFPSAEIIGCSTAGEIVGGAVHDNTLVVTATMLEQGSVFTANAKIETSKQSFSAGEKLGHDLNKHDVTSVFVLAPGLNVNGSDLVSGMASTLNKDVVVTGGLAGDGPRFEKTYTLSNENIFTDTAVALGFIGKAYDVSYGSEGGWQAFGPNRKITKSFGNVLYELDGKPALQLYKEYLGDKAKDLPASGLLYPFAVLNSDQSIGVIRTILNVNEKEGSLTLAGNMPEDSLVRLMHATTEGLIQGAALAGQEANANRVHDGDNNLGLLVSCVGRKLVMGDDVDEEVSVVKKAFGHGAILTGFYSYGEICAFHNKDRRPHLHNQTMTVTRLSKHT